MDDFYIRYLAFLALGFDHFEANGFTYHQAADKQMATYLIVFALNECKE